MATSGRGSVTQRFFWRWDTPEKYQTNMRAYFRMISGIDHVVGRLVEQLEEQGLADNTVIIYTADNGYYLGDRGFAGKWTHYEQSLRVPLIVHDPRLPKAKRGRVLSEMALNSDLASTLIELAGLPMPEAHTGRSLAPLLRGDEVTDWRKDFLCEFLAVPLFDLENDPDQLTNLALGEEPHPFLKRMRHRCDTLVASAGPPMKDIPETKKRTRKKKSK